MNEFINKHAPVIVGHLSGFDRVRFRGTIPLLTTVQGIVAWLKESTGSGRLTGFKVFALGLTERLRTSVEQVAAAARRPIRYLASSALSKEDLVQELLARENISQGLVCAC